MRLVHTQDCTLEMPNDDASVVYRTLSFAGNPDDIRRAAIDRAVRDAGGSIRWRTSETAGRSYALLEVPERADAEPIRVATEGAPYDRAVIALAVFPAVPEALPYLIEALAGSGRPEGVLAAHPCARGLVLEWDPERTRARVVVGLVDVELQRFASGRTAEVLSPLPPAIVAKIAAEGLEAPQIDPGRILELRTERA